MAVPLTHHHIQKRMEHARKAETHQKEMEKMLLGQRLSAVENGADLRAEGARRANRSAQIAAERFFQEKVEKDVEFERNRSRLQVQDELIAKELERRSREEDRKARELQRICEQSPELRLLEEQLKAAYMNKERAAQCAEKKSSLKLDRKRELAIDNQMEYDRQMALQYESEMSARRREHEVNARKVLDDQIAERERLAEEAQKEFAKDKNMIDSIVAQIAEEDRKEREELTLKQMKTKHEIAAAVRAGEEAKLAKKRAEEEDARKIEEHAERMRAREEALEREKAEKKAAMDAQYKRISGDMRKEQREAEELEELRADLHREETERRLAEEQQARKDKRRAMVEDMMRANSMQQALKAKMREEELIAENELQARMKAKYDEDERVEQEKLRKRTEMRKDYLAGIDQQTLERKQLFEQARQQQLRERNAGAEETAYKEKVIEEARKRLLREHAAALQGFLPKGIVKSKEDLEMIRVFDKDGDGVLNSQEVANAQQTLLEFGDTDGDGRLSASEAEAGFARFREGAAAYDRDGDGKFSQAEVNAYHAGQ